MKTLIRFMTNTFKVKTIDIAIFGIAIWLSDYGCCQLFIVVAYIAHGF